MPTKMERFYESSIVERSLPPSIPLLPISAEAKQRTYSSCSSDSYLDNTASESSDDDNQGLMNRMPSARLLGVALIVSLGGSFHFGYQLVITNPTQKVFTDFVNQSHINHYGTHLSKESLDVLWSAIVALLFVGALSGSFILRMVDGLGRKKALYVSMCVGTASIVMAIASYWVFSYELYVVSRFILGCSVSLSMGLAAMYITESSPKRCRGAVSMVTGSMVQIGTVVGSLLAMPQFLGTADAWMWIYGVELVLMVISLISLPFLPESPAILVRQRDYEHAQTAVMFFHRVGAGEAEKIVEELRMEQDENSKKIGLFEIFSIPKLRKRAFIGMVSAFAMAFSGIAVINGFAVEMLRNTGLTQTQASVANLGFAVISLFAIFIAALVVDRYGRRPLLLFANVAILATNLLIVALMYYYAQTGNSLLGVGLIVAITVFIIFFAVGPGPLCYFISAELVGLHARSAAQSWTSAVQMAARAFLLTVYLPMKNAMGGAEAYLILFVLPIGISIIILYFQLPETKNKTVAQVDEAELDLPKPPCGRSKRVQNTPLHVPNITSSKNGDLL